MIITIQYKTMQNSFYSTTLFELNRSIAKGSNYRNLYDFQWVEKIYALSKARASHPRTTATADPTGSSRLFTDPEEEREGKRSQFYSCRP